MGGRVGKGGDATGTGHDTERERERARRVERQLAAAQQITHIGSWEWDARTNSVQWSDELYRIYGLEPQSCEITFTSFLARLIDEDRARVEANVRAAMERGGRFEYPERIRRPDGSVRHLETVGEVVRDADGRATGLIGTCRDVTEERARDERIQLYADVVHNVQIGLSVWRVEDPGAVERAMRVMVNPAAERATGVPGTPRAFFDVFPTSRGTELPEVLAAVARDGRVREIAEYQMPGDGGTAGTYSVKAFALPGKCVGLALEDVTIRARARALQSAEQRVFEMAAAGATLPETLTALAEAIEQQSPGTLVSIQLLDPTGTHIQHGAAPHLPEAFNQIVHGLAVGPASGSCGTAVYRREPVFVTDIERDPLWAEYREIARAYGLRACWSTPVFGSDGAVLGTFALYYREPRAPSSRDLELIARATHVAGIVIQRRQLDDELRDLSARVEAEREDERSGIAREIHDQLGQALTALKLDLAWIGRRVAEGAVPTAEQPRAAVLERVRAASAMTDEVIENVRRISAELRPGVLDDLGLLAAVEWQAQEFEKRAGAICAVTSNMGDAQLDRGLATAVYRVLQEALTNVARHANATRVDVRLDLEGETLRLEVRDDGKGISPEATRKPQSLGLVGIRERARRLRGTADVRRAEGGGTILTLVVPAGSAARRAP